MPIPINSTDPPILATKTHQVQHSNNNSNNSSNMDEDRSESTERVNIDAAETTNAGQSTNNSDNSNSDNNSSNSDNNSSNSDSDNISSNNNSDNNSSNSTTMDSNNNRTFLQKYARTVQHLSHKINRSLLVPLVRISAANPWRCIWLTILISLCTPIIGFVSGSFFIESDNTVLWAPLSSAAFRHKDWIEGDSGFDEDEIRLLSFIVHRNDVEILHQDGISHVFEALETLRASPAYHTVCLEIPKQYGFTSKGKFNKTSPDECEIMGVTAFWYDSQLHAFDEFVDQYDASEIDGQIALRISGDTLVDGQPAPRERIYSPTTKFDDVPVLQSMVAYKMEVYIPSLADRNDYVDYEIEMTQAVLLLNQRWKEEAGGDEPYRVEVLALSSISEETAKAVTADLPLAVATFLIMGIFSALVFTTFSKDANGNRFVHSSAILGAGAMVTIMLSLFFGYGVCILGKVPFTTLNQILPFIIFGIGLDDSFIIWGSYGRIRDQSLPIMDRLMIVMDEIGITIFTTTMTNTVAFAIGAINDIPAIRWMCIYAAVTIFVDFIFQITFFIALLVLNERRIRDNRYDVLCFLKAPMTDNAITHHESNRTGASPQDMDEQTQANTGITDKSQPCSDESSKEDTGGEGASKDLVDSGENAKAMSQSTPHEPTNEQWTDAFVSAYIDVLMHPLVKIAVLIGFAALLVVSSMSASTVEKDFDYTLLTPDGSFVDAYLAADEKYGPTASGGFALIYFRDIDVSDPDIQRQMYDFVDDLVEQHPYIIVPPLSFWLTDFLDYRNETATTKTFNEDLDDFLEIDLYSRLYSSSLVRDPVTGNVDASSTIFLYNVPINAPEFQEEAYQTQLDITGAQPLNRNRKSERMFTYSLWYTVWAHYLSIERIVLWTLLAGLVAITAVASLALPHPSGPVLAVFITAMVDVGVIGAIPWAGFALNSLTVLFVVMAVGFVVDFNVHVIHGYLHAPNTNPVGDISSREERVRHALSTVGGSILLGGLSSFLGFCAMGFSSSDLFWRFFVMLITLVLLGMGHGLIFLPVLLTYIGPTNITF